MSSPTVIDANCMKYFQEERVSKDRGVYTELIEAVFARGFIAVDDKELALQEYRDCCRPSPTGENLWDWLADQMLAKTVQLFEMDRCLDKQLRTMGVPKKDQKWPAIAKGSDSEYILTEDVDLYDPKEKNSNSKRKVRIKESGGRVSIFLKRKHGIKVVTCQSFLGLVRET